MKNNLLLVALLYTAVTYGQFGNVVSQPSESKKANVIRIYIDREGAIYPLKDNIIKKEGFTIGKFRDGYGGIDVANLEAYYKYYQQTDFTKVCVDYGVNDFVGLQRVLLKDYQEKIIETIQRLHAKNLILLIHGFNDATPDTNYETFEDKADALIGISNVYLEVHWDGLINQTHNPIKFLDIWKRAQRNSANTAITLRNVISHIQIDNMYIVTHSLGASVGTRLLFNVYNWEIKKNNPNSIDAQEIYTRAETTPTPTQPNVILAMIAPAIPGQSTFEGLRNTVPIHKSDNYKKIVIGFNKHDYALNKGNIRGVRLILRERFGSSSLGASKRDLRVTKKIIAKHKPPIDVLETDFSSDRVVKKTEHGFEFYLRREHFNSFLVNTFITK